MVMHVYLFPDSSAYIAPSVGIRKYSNQQLGYASNTDVIRWASFRTTGLECLCERRCTAVDGNIPHLCYRWCSKLVNSLTIMIGMPHVVLAHYNLIKLHVCCCLSTMLFVPSWSKLCLKVKLHSDVAKDSFPDFYHFKIDGLRAVTAKHGLTSAQVKEATRIIERLLNKVQYI